MMPSISFRVKRTRLFGMSFTSAFESGGFNFQRSRRKIRNLRTNTRRRGLREPRKKRCLLLRGKSFHGKTLKKQKHGEPKKQPPEEASCFQLVAVRHRMFQTFWVSFRVSHSMRKRLQARMGLKKRILSRIGRAWTAQVRVYALPMRRLLKGLNRATFTLLVINSLIYRKGCSTFAFCHYNALTLVTCDSISPQPFTAGEAQRKRA